MSLKDLSNSLGVKKEESKKENKTFESHAQIKTVPSYKLMAVQFPDAFVDDINKHIDEVIIPNNVSHESQLVGQINQNEKSAQWTFPLDSENGKILINGLEMNKLYSGRQQWSNWGVLMMY